MFRPISDHPEVHIWSLKHTQGKIYIMLIPQNANKIIEIIKMFIVIKHKMGLKFQDIYYNYENEAPVLYTQPIQSIFQP